MRPQDPGPQMRAEIHQREHRHPLAVQMGEATGCAVARSNPTLADT